MLHDYDIVKSYFIASYQYIFYSVNESGIKNSINMSASILLLQTIVGSPLYVSHNDNSSVKTYFTYNIPAHSQFRCPHSNNQQYLIAM